MARSPIAGPAGVLAALVVGLGVGFAAGRADPPSTAATACRGEPVAERSHARGASTASPAAPSADEAPAPLQAISELALLEGSSGAAVRAALRFSDDPDALVASVVDGMARDELEIALATLTGRDRAELEAIRDLHRYAKSYARIAMSGILTDPPTSASNEIEFAVRIADTFEPGPPRTVFDSSSARLFGMFALDSALQGDVLAKWYRVDDPELLMFEEVPLLSRDGEAFVRLDRPEGWPEGDYRLEVYSPGDDFELIAAGNYETRGHRRPRRVSFQ